MSKLCEFGVIYTIGWEGIFDLGKVFAVRSGPHQQSERVYYLIDEVPTEFSPRRISVEAVQVEGWRDIYCRKPAFGSIVTVTEGFNQRHFFYPTPHLLGNRNVTF